MQSVAPQVLAEDLVLWLLCVRRLLELVIVTTKLTLLSLYAVFVITNTITLSHVHDMTREPHKSNN